MIRVTATICGGAKAHLEIETVAQVVAYVQAQPRQPEQWEIIGTPEEEAEIERGLKWERSA